MVVPWGIAFLPNGDALVSERESGRISRVSRHGGRRTVGRIAKIDASAGEGGLLGLAVHPRFAENRWVYAYYTSAADNRVVRMRFRSGSLGRRHAVLTGIPRGDGRHNGGRLAFGPDGMLYITTGDTGNGALAQDKTSLAGKILRVTPRGGVPADNPYGNPVWTLGHRNVEGITFDHQGVAWATEFGESTTDELNKIVKGANYGWPVVEGGDGPGGFHNPFVQWSPTSICSPSGVAIRNGRAWVGALHGACLYSVVLRGPHKKKKVRWFHDRFGRIRTVQRAPDGSLWITTSNRDGRGSPSADDDRVIRITLG
jgi:glucose/arabinose dehydrogenase